MQKYFTVKLCKNTNYFYKVKKKLYIKNSNICVGAGLFAGQAFKSGEFISYYPGEFILDKDANKIHLIT